MINLKRKRKHYLLSIDKNLNLFFVICNFFKCLYPSEIDNIIYGHGTNHDNLFYYMVLNLSSKIMHFYR